jgi:hypothetical protein
MLQVLKSTEDLIKVMRAADGNAPSTGKIYHMMSEAQRKIEADDHPLRGWCGNNPQLQKQVTDIIGTRWDYLHSPILGAGYCLNPEFIKCCSKNAECTEGLMKAIDVMLPDDAARQAARVQFAGYQALEGVFSIDGVAIKDAEKMPAHQWWAVYGRKCPELSTVAIRVLSQVGCCACCNCCALLRRLLLLRSVAVPAAAAAALCCCACCHCCCCTLLLCLLSLLLLLLSSLLLCLLLLHV